MKLFKQILGTVLLTVFIISMGYKLNNSTSGEVDNLLVIMLVLLLAIILIVALSRIIRH